MKNFKLKYHIPKYLYTVLLVVFISIQVYAQGLKLGKIDFVPTGKEVAQNYFQEGLLYLHNFNYDDAIKQFQMAELLDPDFIMAYWGEAMAYNQPIWFWQNYEKARGVLFKMGVSKEQRIGLAKTDLEKDFVNGIEILYNEKDDKHSRDKKYSEFMAGMYKKYPDNAEVGSFYALSLLGLCYDGPNLELWDRASGVLQPIIAKNPDHPGALNYLIFACDDPSRAYKAEKEAVHYGQLASGSEHAIHAPSHIYTALGQWAQSVNSNEAAWKMADELVQKKKLTLEDRDYHTLWWLEYGYLQKGQYGKASQLLGDMNLDARYSKSARLRFFLAAMKASYLVETRKWQSEATGLQVPTEGLDLKIKAMGFFSNGMAAAVNGDLKKVDWFIQKIIDQITLESNNSGQVAEFYHGGIRAIMKNGSAENDVRLAKVMELELKAVKAMKVEQQEDAFKLMDQAITLEDQSTILNGPPIPPKPAHELYGELLLQGNQPQKANEQFDIALKKAPNRSLSLLGKYHAFKMLGDLKSANQIKILLQKNWSTADSQVLADLK